MKRSTKTGIVLLLATGVVLVSLLALRTERVTLTLLEWFGAKVEIAENVVIDGSWTTFDDYYYYRAIDEKTFAILEPRYYQKNVSYLILGSGMALLFDTGPGIRNIRDIVDRLTDLPILVVASHLHYDHIGNLNRFENVALPDISELRSQFSGGQGVPTSDQHLGKIENSPAPELTISTWLPDRQRIDLGDRSLEVFHAPGHTSESVVLYDSEKEYLFSGDFLYPGLLIGFGPRSHQGHYLGSTTRLLNNLPANVVIFGGHAGDQPLFKISSAYSHLNSLAASLGYIKIGRGTFHSFPLIYEVEAEYLLLMPLPWNMRW